MLRGPLGSSEAKTIVMILPFSREVQSHCRMAIHRFCGTTAFGVYGIPAFSPRLRKMRNELLKRRRLPFKARDPLLRAGIAI